MIRQLTGRGLAIALFLSVLCACSKPGATISGVWSASPALGEITLLIDADHYQMRIDALFGSQRETGTVERHSRTSATLIRTDDGGPAITYEMTLTGDDALAVTQTGEPDSTIAFIRLPIEKAQTAFE